MRECSNTQIRITLCTTCSRSTLCNIACFFLVVELWGNFPAWNSQNCYYYLYLSAPRGISKKNLFWVHSWDDFGSLGSLRYISSETRSVTSSKKLFGFLNPFVGIIGNWIFNGSSPLSGDDIWINFLTLKRYTVCIDRCDIWNDLRPFLNFLVQPFSSKLRSKEAKWEFEKTKFFLKHQLLIRFNFFYV